MHSWKKMLLTGLVCFVLFFGALCTSAFAADIGYVNANGGLRLRVGPGTMYNVVTIIPNGASFQIIGYENGWFQGVYQGMEGYACGDYIIVRDETGNRSWVGSRTSSMLGSQIVEKAKQYLGTKYIYGGASPKGFDCSGLTYYVYGQFGYTLNRTAAGQAQQGVYVSKSDLALGDLVMFAGVGGKGTIDHVGIYVGNNQFIHSTRPGSTVQITSLSSSYYAQRYATARRIVR